MRPLLRLLLLCVFVAPLTFAQNTNIPNAAVSHYTTDPTGNGCSTNQFAMNDTASGTFYGCYSDAYAKIGGGAPSGPAGGVLSGTYPNPGLANPLTIPGTLNLSGGTASLPLCTDASKNVVSSGALANLTIPLINASGCFSASYETDRTSTPIGLSTSQANVCLESGTCLTYINPGTGHLINNGAIEMRFFNQTNARDFAAGGIAAEAGFGFSTFGGSGTLLMSATAPTISSGFGTGASVTASNGTAALRINVGTSNTGNGVIGLPTASTGWNCFANDITTTSTTVSQTKQTASTTTSATLQNYTDVSVTHAWVDSDVLSVSCFAY